MNAPSCGNTHAFILKDVSVFLGDQPVLQNIHLHIPAGRWLSIVGPNGAGKSTLLNALAGLQTFHGHIALHRRALQCYTHRQRAQTVAWMGQSETLTEDLNAWDAVMLGRLPHQGWFAYNTAADTAAVEQAMRCTHTWQWRHRALSSLSAGQRQRVLLARVLAVQTPVILLDEPLTNLDPPHQIQWLCTVRRLVQQGITVISVLHEIPIALYANDMLILQQGHVLHHGACAEEATHRALEQVFGQRIQIKALDGQWVVVPCLHRL